MLCSRCNVEEAVQSCAYCGEASYCSDECLGADWHDGHSIDCGSPLPIGAKSSGAFVLKQVLFKDGTTQDVTLSDWLQFNARDATQVDRVNEPPGITSDGFARLRAAARKLYPSKFQTTAESASYAVQCQRHDAAKLIVPTQIPSNKIGSLAYRDIMFELTVRKIDPAARTCEKYDPVFGLRMTSFDATAQQQAAFQRVLDESVYFVNPFNSLQNNEDVDIVAYKKTGKLSKEDVAGGFTKNESGTLFHYKLTKKQRRKRLQVGGNYVFSVTAQPVLSTNEQPVDKAILAEGSVRPLPTLGEMYRIAFSNQGRNRDEDAVPMRVIVELNPTGRSKRVEITSVDMYFPSTLKKQRRS